MKRILLTGGVGFIGSHTCLSLLENIYEIFVIDSFSNSDPLALEKVLLFFKDEKYINKRNFLHLIKGDLRNIEIIDKILKNQLLMGIQLLELFILQV